MQSKIEYKRISKQKFTSTTVYLPILVQASLRKAQKCSTCTPTMAVPSVTFWQDVCVEVQITGVVETHTQPDTLLCGRFLLGYLRERSFI